MPGHLPYDGPMNLSQAQLSNLGGEIAIDDPDFPYRVRVALHLNSERPEVAWLTVHSRDGAPITSTTLAAIPVRQIAGIAASELSGAGDESLYRALAQVKPEGARSWPPDHFDRVWRVAAWARRSGRAGGADGTVAEFWDVDPRTARRWIAVAARRSPRSH